MVKRIIRGGQSEDAANAFSPVEHLDVFQVERLTETYRMWYDTAPSDYVRRVRGRYWLVFLLLRFTGARLGEILRIDDSRDIDFGQKELWIPAPEEEGQRITVRRVPVPAEVITKVVEYLMEFPAMRGRVCALDQGNFRREFYRRAEEAEIPKNLSHPHILRHSRAIEMLRAGVPLTTVQDLLGHVLSSTTAIYLQRSEISVRIILESKGLL
jgi:molybdate transport system regulatory protein